MKCPYCGHPNNLVVDVCAQCKAHVGYLRNRVYLGQQFAFFEASAEQPIVVDLTQADPGGEGNEHCFTGPTIVSRHAYAIKCDKVPPPEPDRRSGWPSGRRARAEGIGLPETLSAIRFPALDLVTVVTERKIYRPQDEVHLFVVGLTAPGEAAELEIQLAGQRVYQARIRLNDAGLCLHRWGDLEEGEYRVMVTLPSRPAVRAQCAFSCAAFSLSPLLAALESHTLDSDRLHFVLRLVHLSIPYGGEVSLALRSGRRVVQKQEAMAERGRLEASFPLDWEAWDTLTVEVTTSDGDTATVAFPSTSWEERQRVCLSPLDPPVEARLLPFREAEGCARGLHYAHGREEDLPFGLHTVVAEEGRILAHRNALLVQLVVFDPIRGRHERFEFRDVKEGDVLAFPVSPPYSLFTLGAFMARGRPYEAWGVVIHPESFQASLTVPEKALPGASIPIRVESRPLAQCLLLVYDARLEHESPLPRLAQSIFQHVRDLTGGLHAGRVAEVVATEGRSERWEDPEVVFMRRAVDRPRLFAPMAVAEAEAGVIFDRLDAEGAPTADPEALSVGQGELESLLLAGRKEFPELVHIELFAVEDRVEKRVRLGDQIGTWRCRAYLFQELDSIALTQDVQAASDLYAEMDLPALMGKGDEVFAKVRYHAEDEATLTITTPAGAFVYPVAGDGTVEVPLTTPGEVVAHIAAQDRSDTSRRWVNPPGVETVTASCLALLQPGEVASGKRVMVFPSVGPQLQETIEALVRYPFG